MLGVSLGVVAYLWYGINKVVLKQSNTEDSLSYDITQTVSKQSRLFNFITCVFD